MRRMALVNWSVLAFIAVVGMGCSDDDDGDVATGGTDAGGAAGETSTGDAGSDTGGSAQGGGAGEESTASGGAATGGAGGAGGVGPEGGAGAAGGPAAGAGGEGGAPGPTVVIHEESVVTGGALWAAGTHVLQRSLTVEDGVLEIEACSVIQMPVDGGITVTEGGALRLIGTEDCPIVITSSQDEPARGDWGEIDFYASADGGNNRFDFVVVEYGGGQGYGTLWLDTGAELAMSNTVVRESADFGVEARDGVTLGDFADNTLTGNALGPIALHANDVGQLGAGTYDGNDVDAVHVVGGNVSTDQTWAALGVPYVIESPVGVSADVGSAHLTLAAGTTLKFEEDTGLVVGELGGLTAVGTASAPVTFTSAKATPAPGDWDEIDFYSGSNDGQNQLEHVVLEYGGGAGYGLVWVESGASVAISTATLTESGSYGVYAEDGAELRAFAGNVITDNALTPVVLAAAQVPELGAGTYTPNGVEGIEVSNGSRVSADGVWKELGVPYLLTIGLDLATDVGSAIVTVEAGTTLLMGSDRYISVGTNGGLTLAGTADAHVTISSQKAAPAAGDWSEIDVYADANGPANVFTFTDIEYGGGADYGQIWLDDGAALRLDDVTFSHGADPSCDVYQAGAASLTGNSTPNICG